MNLYLLRHGIAEEFGKGGIENDEDRPLTPKGERRVAQVAEALLEMGVFLDLILSSPYLRARQTAEIVAESLGLRKRLRLLEELTPSRSQARLVAAITELKPPPRELLLVGHEPSLSSLISLLISGAPGLEIQMKKGGLCKLSTEGLSPSRCARLEWLLHPRQLSMIGR
jgi:phosphohistidine phosphatase